MASQIIENPIMCSSCQRKYKSSALPALCEANPPKDFAQKRPVMRNAFPCIEIITIETRRWVCTHECTRSQFHFVNTWEGFFNDAFSMIRAISWSITYRFVKPWWRHQIETFSALLALREGNSPVTCAWTNGEQIIETSVIWDAIVLIMTSL